MALVLVNSQSSYTVAAKSVTKLQIQGDPPHTYHCVTLNKMFGLCQNRGPDSQKTAGENRRQQRYADISLPSHGKEDVPGEGKGRKAAGATTSVIFPGESAQGFSQR